MPQINWIDAFLEERVIFTLRCPVEPHKALIRYVFKEEGVDAIKENLQQDKLHGISCIEYTPMYARMFVKSM